MSTYRAAGTSAALNDRALTIRSGRAVLGRHAAGVDRAAASERGTVLAEDLSVGPATGSPGHAPAGSGRRATAKAAARLGAAACLGAQPGATRNRWTLRRRVSSQRVAVATQHGSGALAADAQSCAACGGGAGLTANTDAAQRPRDVRSSSTVQRGAFTGDQAGLAVCGGAERRVAPRTCEATGIAGTRKSSACGETRLTTQTAGASQAAAALAAETALAR